jgi:sigma-B regulation protein RsbU (phosphoserine phosphatase)
LSDPGASGLPTEDLEDLYENAPCGYLSVSPDGRIAKANRTLCLWIGLTPKQMIGRRLYDLLSIAGQMFYETHLAPLLRMQGFFNEVALDLVTAGGKALPVLANAAERRDREGRLLFTRVTVFQATERRRYERGLLAARSAAQEVLREERETAELREQFIAVLGHDLRNPLASIGGASRLLRGEALSEKGMRVLALMDGSVLRMAGLIDNLMDFARGRLGGGFALVRNADAPLEPTLQQVVEELRASTPDHTILTDFTLAEPIDCDRPRLAQMISNLLSNAVTHGAPDAPVRLSASTHDGVLELSVSNSGEPIAPAMIDRLFQPFFRGEDRSSQQGLGLGLHIASEIAKAHGGTLTATSSVEETRFTFRMSLP